MTHEPPVEPPDVRASYKPRCVSCDFLIDGDVLTTPYGYCHPACLPDLPA